MKRYLCAAVLGLAMSCGLKEIGGEHVQSGDGTIWEGPGTSIADGATQGKRTIWYATGFEYPEGYDWKSDPESGSVKCSLVVFANGVPMMKVPVGDDYETGSGPDMHRIIDGCLYTDYSSDSETVLKKNGKEVVRYSGREMIVSMHVDDDDIYTLGQPRSGGGFTFRRNGEVQLSRENGYVLSGFRKDSQGLSFAFSETIKASGEALERYYLAVGDEVRQIAVREDIKKVWDVVLYEGEICYLASFVGISTPVLVKGDLMTALEMPSSMKMISGSLIPAEGSIYVEAICGRNALQFIGGIWKDGKQYKIFNSGQIVSNICTWEDGICCTVSQMVPTGLSQIFRCGETIQAPAGFVVMGNKPVAMVDGIMYVAMNPLAGGHPLIWKDGETETLKINGYLSSIYADQPSQDTVRD